MQNLNPPFILHVRVIVFLTFRQKKKNMINFKNTQGSISQLNN